MENQVQQQPRRSQRRREQVDRLQLSDVRRAERRVLPYRQMQRRRQQRQQQQQQADDPQPQAPVARPDVEVISNFSKYSNKDKSTPESIFVAKIATRLSFLYFALYFGSISEFTRIFMTDDAFAFQMLELCRLHSVNFPFQQDFTSVLSVFTHDFVKPAQNPFLFQFSVDLPCYAVVHFLRRFFKLSLLTDDFLLRLALICWAPAAGLDPGFVVGTVKSVLSRSELMTSEGQYFCCKCMLIFKEEKAMLSHIGKTHNWLMTTEPTEENTDECARKYHNINMARWRTNESLQNMVADEHGVNRYIAQSQQLLLFPFQNGEPVPNADAVLLAEEGYHWRGQYHENIPNPYYPVRPQ